MENGVGLIAATLPPLGRLFGLYGSQKSSSGSGGLRGPSGGVTIGGTPFTTPRTVTDGGESSGTQLDRLDWKWSRNKGKNTTTVIAGGHRGTDWDRLDDSSSDISRPNLARAGSQDDIVHRP